MLKIQNLGTSREIIFDNINYVLNQIDYGSSGATHTTFKGINQIGAYLTNSTIDTREISVMGYILANSKSDMQIRKHELYKLLNPLDKFILINDGYKIECVAESTVKFAVDKTENNDYVAKFEIVALCNNPCFVPVNAINVNIAQWQGEFHFPLEIPKTGVVMGTRIPSTIINISNTGDIETGIVIKFTAKSSVTNPSLLNVNTREYIKINRVMLAGEEISINTNYGQKAVTSLYNNTTTNILNYLDFESTFLQLPLGDNIFRYDADENISNIEISINYSPKYLGV